AEAAALHVRSRRPRSGRRSRGGWKLYLRDRAPIVDIVPRSPHRQGRSPFFGTDGMTNRIVRGRATLPAAGLILVLFGASLTAQREAITPLELHSLVECRLDRGEAHRYALTLNAGDYARVTVEQRGIDIVASTGGVDDKATADFQDDVRTSGEEQVEIVAAAAGTYAVVVKAAPGSAAPGAYAIHLDDLRKATDSDFAMHESRVLRTGAGRQTEEGQFETAKSMLERALAVTEEARGADDLQTAAVLSQLGVVYRYLPDNARSEAAFTRALTIADRSLGADHPTAAITRTRFARLYQRMGNRVKGEVLIQQALDAIEKALGTDNRWFVQGLMTVASLRHDGGDYDTEEKITRRAMKILESIDDVESRQYAGLLNHLG